MVTIVPLRFTGVNRWVHLREICGKDEQSVAGTRSIDAMCLLDRIIQNHPGNESAVSASGSISIADRDQILLAVYLNTYGTKVETTATCSLCNCPFDIGFSLTELADELVHVNPAGLNEADPSFPFKTSNGMKFRLPAGEDELAVMGMNPEAAERALFKRCMPVDTTTFNADIIQKAMQKVAPLLDTEFETQCPECSGKQAFHFNLQQYLLTSLINERDKLVAEIHLLAKSYGWGLNEILELPRNVRNSYVSLAGS